MRSSRLRRLLLVLGACAFAVGLLTVSASPASTSAHLPRTVDVGSIAELRVGVSWTGAAPVNTLVRLDGIPGVRASQFSSDGYESRVFCDDDNAATVIARGRRSLVWVTGNLWSGADCEVRLFFTTTRAGSYVARVHFLTGQSYSALVARGRTAKGQEFDIPLTVRSSL